MNPAWFLLAFFGPPVAALLAGVFLAPRNVHPLVAIGLNALSPGAGLAAAGRPTIEASLGVLMAQASMVIVGTMGSVGHYLPIMVIGGLWASVYTPYNPLVAGQAQRGTGLPLAVSRTPQTDTLARPAPRAQPRTESEDDDGAESYAVEVRCTECGADVAVPVLQHMARCSFCGSDHLVVGHEETLYLTIPERTPTETELKDALLDH